MQTCSTIGRVAGSTALGAWACWLGAIVALGCAARLTPPAISTVTAPTPAGSSNQGGSSSAPSLAVLAKMQRVADVAAHVRDARPEARRVIAGVLARLGGAEATPLLGELAADSDLPVAATAVAGLGTWPAAHATLVAALRQRSDSDEEHARLATLLAQREGTAGLLALLAWLPEDADWRWRRQEIVFATINAVNDPRGADALATFIAQRPHPHFAFRAATALAQIDDLRAIAPLVEHLRLDPAVLYARGAMYELALSRGDGEREVAAMLIADLAELHPDRRSELRAAAEDALLEWLRKAPPSWLPDTGWQALAALESSSVLPTLRAWVSPIVPLPPVGQQPPVSVSKSSVARYALRYLGALRDDASRNLLLDALSARPRTTDFGLDSSVRGRYSDLYSVVRDLGLGAADGLARWGARAAFEPLLRHVADPMNLEETRQAACLALPRVATDRDAARLVDEALRQRRGTKDDEFQRRCLLRGLGTRGVRREASRLLPLLDPPTPPNARALAARVIGRTALTPALERELLRRAQQGTAPDAAILAILLGGTEDAVIRAFASASGNAAVQQKGLLDLWYGSFMSLALEDFDAEFLIRVVRNADVLASVDAKGELGSMAPFSLGMALGFHASSGVTPVPGWVVLRERVFALAQGANAADRRGAIRALRYLGAYGHLLALAAGSGAAAAEAAAQLSDQQQSHRR